MPLHNLKYYPEERFVFDKKSDYQELSLGDLHGNALKLIYILLYYDFIDLDKIAYYELYNLYIKDAKSLSSEDILSFEKILSKIKYNPSHIKLIRFLGDVLSDRGSNDIFTLLIFQKLFENKFNIEIVFSNHDMEFLMNYYGGKTEYFSAIENYQYRSMLNLYYLLDHNVIDNKLVEPLVKNYFNHLKALSFTINKDNSKSINMYSHAPVGIESVRAFAENYHLEFACDNIENLALTIKKINSCFCREAASSLPRLFLRTRRNYFNYIEFYEKFCIDLASNSNKYKELFLQNIHLFPLYYTAWNRNTELVEAPINFVMRVVHGHSGQGEDTLKLGNLSLVNLDNSNNLGFTIPGYPKVGLKGSFGAYFIDPKGKPLLGK